MIWLKVVLAALVIGFCALLGYLAAGKYRRRKSFFTQLCALNEAYLSELKFARRPLAQFLAANDLSGDFAKCVSGFTLKRRAELSYSYLTQTEKNDLQEYFRTLGRGSSGAQSGYFSAQRDALAEKKRLAEQEAKERGALYLKLGFLAGLAFVILIV